MLTKVLGTTKDNILFSRLNLNNFRFQLLITKNVILYTFIIKVYKYQNIIGSVNFSKHLKMKFSHIIGKLNIILSLLFLVTENPTTKIYID